MTMNQEPPNKDKDSAAEVVGDALHEMGDEIAAVVSAPGEFTYRTIFKFLDFVGGSSVLLGRCIRYIFQRRLDVRETIRQMGVIGVASLPIVLITVAFSGAVLALYMAQIAVRWGLGSYSGGVVGVAVAREMGPVLTAVVITARAGSAIAAELGSMKVTEQIDALRALAVSPVEYLVVPRLLAALIMLPVITVFAVVIGTFGGYVVAVANGVASGGFIGSLKATVVPYDVAMGLLKSVFFAAVIVIVGSYQGLQTTGGAAGVGKSTTSAVVISIVAVYILNFFLAYVMFGGKTAFL